MEHPLFPEKCTNMCGNIGSTINKLRKINKKQHK